MAEQKHVGQEREIIYQLAHDLARTSDIRTIGEYLFAQTKEVLKADGGYLLLSAAGSTEYRGVAAYGVGSSDFAQERVALNEPSIAFLVTRKNDAVVVTDFPRSPLISARIRRKYHQLREVWSVPLLSGEQLTGVFSIGYLTPQEPSIEKLRFLELLGNEAALAIERIRLAEGLREREAQLRCLFESQVIGIFFVDLHSGNIIDANDAFLQLISYRREDVVSGKLKWEAISPPEYLPLDKQGIAALRRAQVCAPFEKEYTRQDGSRIPVMIGAAPLEGAPETCVVFALDISKRKQAETLLHQERDMTAAVLDTAGALVVVLDRQGHIVRFNRACERTTGYSFEEVRGRWFGDLLPPEERTSTLATFTELLRATQVESRRENHWLTRDGRRRLIAWSNTYLRNTADTVEHVVGTGLDITEQRKAEQRQTAQFAITRVLSSAGSLLEAHTALLQICCEYLGWELGEVWTLDPDVQVMRCGTIWHVPSVEVAEFVATSRRRTFVRGQGVPGHVWARGTSVWIPDVTADSSFIRQSSVAQAGFRTVLSFPLHSDGKVVGTIGLFSRKIQPYDPDLAAALADIVIQLRHFVERRRADDALRHLSGQLLQAQDEERRRIARELHDSTAQNLSALKMFLSQIKDAEATLEPRVRRSLAESLELAEHSLSEVRTLSYLLHPPFLEEMGLASALGWYIEGFGQRSGINVTLEVPPEFSRLSGNSELVLFRIVQESLTNIHQHAGSPVAWIRLLRHSSHVILTVTDEGCGMPPEVLERVQTYSSSIGVGIAGMHERVRQLGGRLEIHSSTHGTTITVTLPVEGGHA